VKIKSFEIVITVLLVISFSMCWSEIFKLRDYICTLQRENELMSHEIEHNAKMLSAMEFKMYTSCIPGK